VAAQADILGFAVANVWIARVRDHSPWWDRTGFPPEPTRLRVCAGSAGQGRPLAAPLCGVALTGALSGVRNSGVFGSGVRTCEHSLASCERPGLVLGRAHHMYVIRHAGRTSRPPSYSSGRSRLLVTCTPARSRVRGRFLSGVSPWVSCGDTVLSAPALSETRTEGGYRTCSIARSYPRGLS
jgi:hypothetical protein